MRVALLALLVLGLAVPATAAKKRTMSETTFNAFEACEQKAVAQGLVHGQAGHTEFVKECMGMRPNSVQRNSN